MKSKKSSKPKAAPAPEPAAAPARPQRPANGPLCPVIAIGASAGGLEAFQEVLDNLPSHTGLSFVLIQHLDPTHVSILSELLAAHTRMPVVQVKDGMPVEPNKVYVIPPNVGMRLSNGQLILTERPPGIPHLPIDEFFRSMAEELGSRAIAVVLSGTASDGTLGLKAVKEVGGITIAQDQTAKYDAMPRNAIAAGWVDLVLPPDRIAQEVVRLCRHPFVTGPEAPAEAPAPGQVRPESERFREIFLLLRSATGVDFTQYKHGTLQRRILRRMALHKLEKEDDYLKLLKDNRAELKSLFQDILISVTGFFRENATFEALKQQVLPHFFRDRSPENPIRVWVPGCSTGEEAYSIAMVLLEHMREAPADIPVQIFGTDLSEPALERARAGVYPESIATDVSPERLRRFFVKVDGQYQISRPVRDLCIFAQQNLIKDPPFSKLDLVICRNVLIYLGAQLQAKVMRFFHYGLKPNGYLVLGLSETVGASTELFNPIDKRLKIYTRKPGPSNVNHMDFGAYEDGRLEASAKQPAPPNMAQDMQRRVDQFILGRYCPPAVLVDEELNILEFHGHTSPYLEHAAGQPVLNLLRMIRSELAVGFRKLFDRARKKHTTAHSDIIDFSYQDHIYHVRVSITPMVVTGRTESHYLIVFEEQPPPSGKAPRAAKVSGKASGLAQRIRELEEELSSTKQYLESVIEEQQATTEELKSANEEVQSSNEELQSTNEELLTAKEELQSTNEELTTVNEEMHSRNAELSQINNDLTNLLSSVNIPIVMLGNDLRIRRFTPQAEKVLNLLPTDVGRPVSDFKPKIDLPDLEQIFLDVIENLRVREREVQDREGRWFSMWVRPYRTSENKIDGAVMALFDVTERKQASEARYRRLFEAAKDGIIVADAETGEILDLNPYLAKTFGISRPGSVGMRYWDLELFRGTELDAGSLKEMHENETVQWKIQATAKSGERLDLEVLGNVYPEGERRAVQLNVRDVSERRRLDEASYRPANGGRDMQRLEATGRLTAGVAEELRDLLSGLAGAAEQLKHRVAPREPIAADLDRIRQELDRATRLNRQLLVFGGASPAQPEVLNLNELIEEMQQVVRGALADGFELRIAPEAELRPVRVDRARIEQAILNLVMHSRDAMGSGGVLTISTRNMSVDAAYAREHPAVQPGEYSVLEMADNSLAIDGGRKVRSLDLSSKANGLAEVAEIVRQSGGHLWAASELGRGNIFRIFLPPAAGEPD